MRHHNWIRFSVQQTVFQLRICYIGVSPMFDYKLLYRRLTIPLRFHLFALIDGAIDRF